MRFNDLLRAGGIDPAACSIVLHTPVEPKLKQFLPWLAAERPELFNAYQARHSGNAARGIASRPWIASFVATVSKRMVLAGVFEQSNAEVFPVECMAHDIHVASLFKVYAEGIEQTIAGNLARGITHYTKFDLQPCAVMEEWCGRVVIDQPPGRGYVRIAANLDPAIRAIAEASELEPMLPEWQDVALDARMLRDLPGGWAARLREWRGIYLILDQSDGARYVGAAYGKDNLLGRWRAHVAQDTGATKELSLRDPLHFRFTILELASPTASAQEVVIAERRWMDRLGTIGYGLNT